MKVNKSLFNDYQALINSVSETSELTNETLHYISEIDIYEGYSEAVANQLFQKSTYANLFEFPCVTEQIFLTAKMMYCSL